MDSVVSVRNGYQNISRVLAPQDEMRGTNPHSTPTFSSFALRWLDHYLTAGGHDGQGGRAGQGYRSILEQHLLPAFGDRDLGSIGRQEYRDFIRDLKSATSARGRRYAPRSVGNVHRLAQRIFQAAIEDELLAVSPCRLAQGDLPRARDADPAWRPGARFTTRELAALFTDERIPLLHRVTFCLLFFFAGRTGEVSALRWTSWDPEWEEPLGRLVISHAYSTVDSVIRPTKTGIAREFPVHPFLDAVLADWYAGGWARTYGGWPRPGDLIVAGSLECDGTQLPLRNDRAAKWLRAACMTIGIRVRSPYSFRSSLITVAQAAGLPSELVKALTHPNNKEVFSGYSRFSWREKCAIERIDLSGEGPGL